MPFESDELVVIVAKTLADDDEDHMTKTSKNTKLELDEFDELDALALIDDVTATDW